MKDEGGRLNKLAAVVWAFVRMLAKDLLDFCFPPEEPQVRPPPTADGAFEVLPGQRGQAAEGRGQETRETPPGPEP